MERLFTIGHSTVPAGTFVSLLKEYDISYVVDVRSMPYSKYAPQYNREALRYSLKACGIVYLYKGDSFGARQENAALYNAEGVLNFELVRETPKFKEAVGQIIRGVESGQNIALMCTEKDPFDCHRAIMVGRGFELCGIEVAHILHDGKIQTQARLNERLLDKYFPGREQLSLFAEEDGLSSEQYLLEAYRKRNSDIGYHYDKLKERAVS